MMKKEWCSVHKLLWLLLIIGGLNWGLVGAFDWNLVEAVFGTWPVVVKVVYILVGLSAIGILVGCKCKKCKSAK